jgi:hypothetical protein
VFACAKGPCSDMVEKRTNPSVSNDNSTNTS